MAIRQEFLALNSARHISGLRWFELLRPVTAGALTMLASITLTVVSAWLITRAWQMPPVLDLTIAVTAVRALGISRGVFRYIERFVSHDVALKCAERTRTTAYRRLAENPQRALKLGRGELLTRLGSDIDAMSDVIVRAVIPYCVALLTAIMAVTFAAILSWQVALVLCVGLIMAAFIPPVLAARAAHTAELRQAQSLEAYTAAVDRILLDSATLRVRNQLPSALAKADVAAMEQAAAVEAGTTARASGEASSLWIHGYTVVGVLIVASFAYVAGGIPTHSPQWLAVLVLLTLAAFESVSMLPEAAISLTKATGAARRLGSITSMPLHNQQIESAACLAHPDLLATDLVYGWESDLGVCNLQLPFGSRHEIIAPSGTGKTTLLLTLAGVIPSRGGSIIIGGHPPEAFTTAVLFSPEDGHIFATTIRDNLAIGAKTATDSEMNDVLTAVGLAEWITHLPKGLDTVLATGSNSLSGGQRRRMLLARALLSDAPILLLDEPTEHLDSAGAKEIMALLDRNELPGKRPRRTVVVVRHPR